MNISESGRHYLANYYLLEQTREDAHRFLEEIARSFSALVDEHLKLKGDSPLSFSVYEQKGGGYVEFILRVRKDVEHPKEMDDWKYSIVYRDAMRTQKLSDSTQCRVFGWSPKGNSRQQAEVERMAKTLGLARDPYDEVQFDLVGSTPDEVVDGIAQEFVSLYDDYARIVQATIEASKG